MYAGRVTAPFGSATAVAVAFDSVAAAASSVAFFLRGMLSPLDLS